MYSQMDEWIKREKETLMMASTIIFCDGHHYRFGRLFFVIFQLKGVLSVNLSLPLPCMCCRQEKKGLDFVEKYQHYDIFFFQTIHPFNYNNLSSSPLFLEYHECWSIHSMNESLSLLPFHVHYTHPFDFPF